MQDTITVYGEGRGLRVIWFLEELGLPYRFVEIDLLSDRPHPPDFVEINPSAYIPALRDGDTTMVESIAILDYLAARNGPTPLAVAPDEPGFPAYRQFLMLGEAGLATSAFYLLNARRLSAGAETLGFIEDQFHSRLALVDRQLSRSPWVAGDRFTAADISVVYGLNLMQFMCGHRFDGRVADYAARARARPAYHRALDTCAGTRDFYRRVEAAQAS
jgi:glutathione S-transferase